MAPRRPIPIAEDLPILIDDDQEAVGIGKAVQEVAQKVEQDVRTDHAHELVAPVNRCAMRHHRPGSGLIRVGRCPVGSTLRIVFGQAVHRDVIGPGALQEALHTGFLAQHVPTARPGRHSQ